ncbi:MAG: glycosyltransferase family 2 protein [Calothrix sp. C42_A2020_038]|nr:glycosyltransferase family 2 protein [Calothrix sp. C42_A2020_038]
MESKHLQVVADFSAAKLNEEISTVLVHKAPLRSCEVCVIVPVRNEAQTLVHTLSALAHQFDLQGQRLNPQRYEIVVLLNNCTDNSVDIARNFAQNHQDLELHLVEITLPPQEAYIGRVRQLLMDEAYFRLSSIGRKRGIIASTDGDSQVSPTWIAANLYEITHGADAVGGRIITSSAGRAELDPYARACFLREVGYRYLIAELESYLDPDPVDPFPRHYQHYGASLAVTVEMYALAGGLPAVPTPEDVAFYNALVRANARFRHSPLVRVTTSARQTGRTNNGLASQLNQWTKMGRQNQAFLVESAQAIETRLRARQQLRKIWSCVLNGSLLCPNQVAFISDTLGVDTEWLLQELMQAYTFGQLFEQVEQRMSHQGIWNARFGYVEIEEAIWNLRELVQQLRTARKAR